MPTPPRDPSAKRPEGELPPRPLDLDLGFARTIRLVAVPRTAIWLVPSGIGGQITQLSTKVPISGGCSGFSESEIPAALAWIVRRSATDIEEHVVEGVMRLSADHKTFRFLVDGADPQLDVEKHRLFGVGNVGFRVTPAYPHAQSATLAPAEGGSAGLWFDNRAGLGLSPRVDRCAIGTPLKLRFTRGALVDRLIAKGLEFELFLEDLDMADGEKRGEGHEFAHVWREEEDLTWLVGCTMGSTPGRFKLAYAEANEEGDYELGYRFRTRRQLGRGKFTKPVDVEPPRKLFDVSRPALTEFSLACRDELVPSLWAHGAIAGFHPALAVNLTVSLWRRTEPRSMKYQRMGEPVTATLEQGRFAVRLYKTPNVKDACFDDPMAGWLASWAPPTGSATSEPILFATVALHKDILDNPKLPVGATLGHPATMDTFDEGRGRMTSADRADAICSREGKGGFAHVARLKDLVESFYGGPPLWPSSPTRTPP